MAITGRTVLFIIACLFYTPAAILSLFPCIRHCQRGRRAQIAWIFLYLFCHIRVAEAALGIATIKFPSVAVYSTSILFSLIGVPTLLLTTLGLLNRVHFNLAKNYPTRIKAWYFVPLQVPFTTAIGLCASGASTSTGDLSDGGGIYKPQISTKVGIMLCVVGYLAMIILTGAMLRRQPHIEPSEQRLLHIVTGMLPLLFIRLTYTILVTFMDRNAFKTYDGNVLVVGLMAVLPEMIMVIIYMVEGFTVVRLPKDAKKSKRHHQRGGCLTEVKVLHDDASTSQPVDEAQE